MPECPSLQPKGSPGCCRSARTPRCGGRLFPTPTALPQRTQKLFKQVLLRKIGKKYAVCSVYSANSDKGFAVIRSTLFPQFLVCDLYRDLNLYSQGHPYGIFLIRKILCCYYLIFFSLQVQEFFVLLGTTVVLCCLIKVSKMMTFLLL